MIRPDLDKFLCPAIRCQTRASSRSGSQLVHVHKHNLLIVVRRQQLDGLIRCEHIRNAAQEQQADVAIIFEGYTIKQSKTNVIPITPFGRNRHLTRAFQSKTGYDTFPELSIYLQIFDVGHILDTYVKDGIV